MDATNNTDHRIILEKMSASDARQEQVLHHLQEMRNDMKTILLQSKEDARRDREQFRRDIGDLHERVNETTEKANRNETQLALVMKVMWFVGGPAIAGIVYAVIDTIKG